MYLLDTNHCSRFLNGEEVLRQKFSTVEKTVLQTCVIVRAELVLMAERSQQRSNVLSGVHGFLSRIAVHNVDSECADIYGQIKAALIQKYGPKEKAKKRKYDLQKHGGITDNDLWIASIALRRGLIVVSHDGDFDRIKEVTTQLKVESWIIQ